MFYAELEMKLKQIEEYNEKRKKELKEQKKIIEETTNKKNETVVSEVVNSDKSKSNIKRYMAGVSFLTNREIKEFRKFGIEKSNVSEIHGCSYDLNTLSVPFDQMLSKMEDLKTKKFEEIVIEFELKYTVFGVPVMIKIVQEKETNFYYALVSQPPEKTEMGYFPLGRYDVKDYAVKVAVVYLTFLSSECGCKPKHGLTPIYITKGKLRRITDYGHDVTSRIREDSIITDDPEKHNNMYCDICNKDIELYKYKVVR